jgi:putative DNA methylase
MINNDTNYLNNSDIPKNAYYLPKGIKAEAHTPVYKMHKYFARRPQNVFRKIIEHYTNTNNIILDPFCGGGVTLFEGLSTERKVVACDINALATFTSQVQVELVDVEEYARVISLIRERVKIYSDQYLQTEDRDTRNILPVRWYEYAYLVKCPNCNSETPLENGLRKKRGLKPINGWYLCNNCGHEMKAIDVKRVGIKLLSVTYKVTTRKTQKTVNPNNYDYELQKKSFEQYDLLRQENKLCIPDFKIPEFWDRQKEDCLHRKGVYSFEDMFTKRNLLIMSYFLNEIKAFKNKISRELYQLLLFTFSATLRYTNNMTISADSWMDGRPISWAKHAYWISNQFVEVNPVEYIDKRITAILAGLKYQYKMIRRSKKTDNFIDLLNNEGNYMVLNQSSDNLPIPDESIDAVITDPPYGSNVQYGELSSFWLVWIYDELNLEKENVLDLSKEILVQRKKSKTSKQYSFYYNGLKGVFLECYRVLKPGSPLIFTFNNKDPQVWLAVLRAVIESGFILEPDGIIYQEPIINYKNTAHTRYAGSVHGDFIYTFIKPKAGNNYKIIDYAINDSTDVDRIIRNIIISTVEEKDCSSVNEIFYVVYKNIIPRIAGYLLTAGNDLDVIKKKVSGVSLDTMIQNLCELDSGNNSWKLRKS